MCCLLTFCRVLAVVLGLFGTVFFAVWYGRFLHGPRSVLLVPACQLFPSSARFLALLCSIHVPWIVPHVFVASSQCSRVSAFCCRLWAVWVLVCVRRPAGPAVLAVVFCPCLRVSRILLHLHFRPPCSSAQGRFPSFSSCWGGSLVTGFDMRFFLGFYGAFLTCFCAWVFHVCSFSGGLFFPPALLGARVSGLDVVPLCCCVFCHEFSTACFLRAVSGPSWGGIPSFSSFWVPLPMFALLIGSCGSCFCPRNFVPCNALTSSSGLAARLVLLGSCLFVACSPYSG